MRKTVLFIAMSLDGYIADSNGKVDWLQGESCEGEDDMQTYHEFVRDVDTVVMGWNTYHQIAEELSPDAWYYQGLQSYVLTHRDIEHKEEIQFINEDICKFIQQLRVKNGDKHIWICGGAGIVQPLIKAELIDRYHISIIPTLLGDGIRLFQAPHDIHNLKLIHTQSYNGIVDVVYEKRQ